MNILDENISDNQRRQLASWRIPVKQVGHELGRKGMKDDEIIPLLHKSNRPTFFTRDDGFYDWELCHRAYCLVYLDVRKQEVALFARRLLRHPLFNTKAKRLGKVIRVSHVGLSFWDQNAAMEAHLAWELE